MNNNNSTESTNKKNIKERWRTTEEAQERRKIRQEQNKAYFFKGEQMTRQLPEMEGDIEMKIFYLNNKIVFTPSHLKKLKKITSYKNKTLEK